MLNRQLKWLARPSLSTGPATAALTLVLILASCSNATDSIQYKELVGDRDSLVQQVADARANLDALLEDAGVSTPTGLKALVTELDETSVALAVEKESLSAQLADLRESLGILTADIEAVREANLAIERNIRDTRGFLRRLGEGDF